MTIINKVEALIFNQTMSYPQLQLIKNATVIINTRCIVKNFTDELCQVANSEGQYLITGTNLRIKEYGDLFIRIESDGIKTIEIRKNGDQNEQ